MDQQKAEKMSELGAQMYTNLKEQVKTKKLSKQDRLSEKN